MKFVEDTKAGKAISAYLVFNKKGELVGKINAHHGQGRTWVNVWDFTREYGDIMQTASASGYGYDRLTAALNGLTCGGLRMYDHSDTNADSKRAMEQYKALPESIRLEVYPSGLPLEQRERDIDRFIARWAKKGVSFANWRREEGGYMSAYVDPGVKGLESRGLKVYQAI